MSDFFADFKCYLNVSLAQIIKVGLACCLELLKIWLLSELTFLERDFGTTQSDVDSTHQSDFFSWPHTSLVCSPRMGLGMGHSVKSQAGRNAAAPGHSPDFEDNVPKLRQKRQSPMNDPLRFLLRFWWPCWGSLIFWRFPNINDQYFSNDHSDLTADIWSLLRHLIIWLCKGQRESMNANKLLYLILKLYNKDAIGLTKFFWLSQSLCLILRCPKEIHLQLKGIVHP